VCHFLRRFLVESLLVHKLVNRFAMVWSWSQLQKGTLDYGRSLETHYLGSNLVGAKIMCLLQLVATTKLQRVVVLATSQPGGDPS